MLFNDGIVDLFIIICPVCGFTFRNSELDERKKKIKCPMCNNGITCPRKFKLQRFYLKDKKIVND
ncbi:MAG: hypothetical protein ACFE9Z_08375 [Promethearchaeota archaeon]